ncbi:Hydrogenase assembly protein HoxX [Moritella sp. JT01]|uniref:hydrogenase maturation protein n=1 Tax=Moritella sp. JT01 TaxID=756698 RepID=UPI00079C4FCE|nr:hydrogenase maturation protein [Moritella sp. JT01]KXO13383.1 Hydrogenase assembly protein HoxX [Moritella sp. JT01]
MRILLLVTAFNGLSQRVQQHLSYKGHQINVNFAVNELELRNTLAQFQPELILCPFLKERIPEDIWRDYLSIIIHPGIKGDRGPSSLDWAIIEGQAKWGVTALQADSEMDAGDIWVTDNFTMRKGSKASLYRKEVSNTAIKLVDQLITCLEQDNFQPEALNYSNDDVRGELKPLMRQPLRTIDWLNDTTEQVLAKINAADSFPGVLDEFNHNKVYLFGVHIEAEMRKPFNAKPKQIIGKRRGAILVATKDGLIWISHLKQQKNQQQSYFKLPATEVLGPTLVEIDELALPILADHKLKTFKEISYSERNNVGYLYFNFHNGAMSTLQCQSLIEAYHEVCQRDINAIVLMGGDEFWSNGIHLNTIEAAENSAQESWLNINAINDFVKSVLETKDKLTIAALGNNAGAGGVMLALACDYVFAREGIILNPHYKSMGLYGSEYWTYSLPKRVGEKQAQLLTQQCLPLGAKQALNIGLVDSVFTNDDLDFTLQLSQNCSELANSAQFGSLIANKRAVREQHEAEKPLASYRDEELAEMKKCFYIQDSQYHRLRHDFVYKICPTETPKHLKLANKCY